MGYARTEKLVQAIGRGFGILCQAGLEKTALCFEMSEFFQVRQESVVAADVVFGYALF
jgi:hypothetical protein